jgi:Tat protein translocase TatB subunit
MFNVGTGELLLLMVLALVVLGPDKLPAAARQAGRWIAEFRRISNGFQQEFRDAVDSAMVDPARQGANSFNELTSSFTDTFKLGGKDVAVAPADELSLYDTGPEDGPIPAVTLDKVEPIEPEDTFTVAEPPRGAPVDVDGPSDSFS